MKTVTVLKTFQNEGETVRPARAGQKPTRITVSVSRARELEKMGLVGEAEDAPDPTPQELEELQVRGFAGLTIDSSDSSVITMRCRTSRQADALRGLFRQTAERAKEHVSARKADGEVIDGDGGETASGVLFTDNRKRAENDAANEAAAAAAAVEAARIKAEEEAEAERKRQADQAAADEAARAAAAAAAGGEGGEGGTGGTGGPAASGGDAGTGGDANAEPPPAPSTGRRQRGNRTGGAAE